MQPDKAVFPFTRALAGLALMLPLGLQAAVLPGPNEMSTLDYGDFTVYSLELLDKCSVAGDIRCLPYQPISASPGQTSTELKIIVGEPGQRDNSGAVGSLGDDAFLGPGPASNEPDPWLMTQQTDPTPSFDGDQPGTWEVQVGALRDFLDGGDLIFMFRNNQSGNGSDQWLNLWAQARLYDSSDAEVGCFEFSNSGSPCIPLGDSVPEADYVTVFTSYCVDKLSGAVVGFAGNDSACQGFLTDLQGNPASGAAYFVNGNLGAASGDNAAYSVGLNTLLASADDDWVLSVNIQIGNNTNGTERVWITNQVRDIPPPNGVPTPGSLILLGSGLLGLAATRRRWRLEKSA